MSLLKKAAIGIASVFCLSAAPVQAQMNDPMSALNPNGIYTDDGDSGPAAPLSKSEKWTLGSIGITLMGMGCYLLLEEKIEERQKHRKEKKSHPKP